MLTNPTLTPTSKVDCWCSTCRPITVDDTRFVVCPDCGNKPEARACETALNKDSGYQATQLPASAGVGHDPLVVGIPLL